MTRRGLLGLLFQKRSDPGLSFADVYNSWIKLFFESRDRGVVHWQEKDKWKETKKRWQELRKFVDRFYNNL